MELLIPGLILVGLMVYASTRIKRSATKAFEAEWIENDRFRLQKAEGLLHVLNGDPACEFEAYSKGFGTVDGRDVRLATATVRLLKNESMGEAAGTDDEIVSDLSEVIGEHHYRVAEARDVAGDAEFRILRKAAEGADATYVLEVRILNQASTEFMHKLEAMVDSFEIK